MGHSNSFHDFIRTGSSVTHHKSPTRWVHIQQAVNCKMTRAVFSSKIVLQQSWKSNVTMRWCKRVGIPDAFSLHTVLYICCLVQFTDDCKCTRQYVDWTRREYQLTYINALSHFAFPRLLENNLARKDCTCHFTVTVCHRYTVIHSWSDLLSYMTKYWHFSVYRTYTELLHCTVTVLL